MLVRDAMTREPAHCTPATPLTDAARMMVAHDCGALPVVRAPGDRRPVGVISDRDLVARSLAEGKDPLDLTVADCMSNSCVTIAAEASIEDCCRVMEAYQVRRVLVVDEHDALIGIVAQADIARAASDEDIAAVVKEVSQPAFAQSAPIDPRPASLG